MKARARRWGDKVKETFKGGCEDTDGGETGGRKAAEELIFNDLA